MARRRRSNRLYRRIRGFGEIVAMIAVIVAAVSLFVIGLALVFEALEG